VSAFTGPLAQVRKTLRYELRPRTFGDGLAMQRVDECLAALDRVERLDADMESALRRCKMRAIDAYNECGMAAPQDFFLQDIERIVEAALSAREEGAA